MNTKHSVSRVGLGIRNTRDGERETGPSVPGPSQQQAGPSLPSCPSLNLHTRVRGRDGLRGCVGTSPAGTSVLRRSLCPHASPLVVPRRVQAAGACLLLGHLSPSGGGVSRCGDRWSHTSNWKPSTMNRMFPVLDRCVVGPEAEAVSTAGLLGSLRREHTREFASGQGGTTLHEDGTVCGTRGHRRAPTSHGRQDRELPNAL